MPALLRKLSSGLRKMLPEWSEKISPIRLALIVGFELNLKMVAGFFFSKWSALFFCLSVAFFSFVVCLRVGYSVCFRRGFLVGVVPISSLYVRDFSLIFWRKFQI